MKKSFFYLGLLTIALSLSGCAKVANKVDHHHHIDETCIDKDGNLTEPIDIATHNDDKAPEAKYEENAVLVKSHVDIDVEQLKLDIADIEELYPNSPWKKISLKDNNAFKAVKYLRSTNLFEMVDYDYLMDHEVDGDPIDISSNPRADEQTYLDIMGVKDAWNYMSTNGFNPGGDSDIVVAVIDSGVDINHVDLRDNIWTNVGEIPGNDVDDDNNGYIDDVHGWDFVNTDNYPMDDNGHGTHVAGIIAARNNNIGIVGVAYNCKIMPIKAADMNGRLSNSDITKAIQYAYMNGASVINMSFSGGISVATQEALIEAYNSCALVASAGNNSKCNDLQCEIHYISVAYPAALPYVVGVMSCSDVGTSSPFTNFDHIPNNKQEYEVYACGEQLLSCFPNNSYVKMSGTSMAAPVISGIAALLKSCYRDVTTFPPKYLNSQICDTSEVYTNVDSFHPIANAYDAFAKLPKPHIVSVYDYYSFEGTELSPNNNGDRFFNPGERVKIGIELSNRGGLATNVVATIDAREIYDQSYSDPAVTIINDTINLADIGTYSVRDCGKIIEDNQVVDVEQGFIVDIAPNALNEHIINLNLHVAYRNGLDENDTNIYTFDSPQAIKLKIANGYVLPEIISTDTVFTSERMYILDKGVAIPQGVSVTFEAGCKIQFYPNGNSYVDTSGIQPSFINYGNLTFNGTEDNPIEIFPDEEWHSCSFKTPYGYGSVAKTIFKYCRIQCINMMNDEEGRGDFDHCYFDSNCSFVRARNFTNNNCVWAPYIDVNGNVIGNNIYGGSNSFAYNGRNGEISSNCFIFVPNNGSGHNHYLMDWEGSLTFNDNVFAQSSYTNILDSLNKLSWSSYSGRTMSSKGNMCRDLLLTYTSSIMSNYITSNGTPLFDKNDAANHDNSLLFPYIQNIEIFNEDDSIVRTVGSGNYKTRVTFSRPLDTNKEFKLFYGSIEPYSDFELSGHFVSSTIWEADMKITGVREGGTQYFRASGGVSDSDKTKTLINNASTFFFDINMSSSQSMMLQANECDEGIELRWMQDDYDTLMGYNIYRSDSEDGNYTRINPSVVPGDTNIFVDDSCEPGKTYWYTFTVVLSDFSESSPAGKVSAMARDTISPTIYHNPVNQGYAGNNLVISCTASDNIAVQSATLYYRTIGETAWKSLPMAKVNDRFSATIFGSEVSIDGLEYYIAVSDGRNTVTRGSADSPYTVIVKDASLLNNLGDVDGDGVVTTKDALMIIRAINDELILTDDQFKRADLNKDNELSTFEALRILQYVNGNVSTLDM